MGSAASRWDKARLILQLIRFDRPVGWMLLLWPTLAALWLAAQGFPGWHLLVVFVLGTILMRSAGCAVNDVADRDFDRHVKRTAMRPVTSGALTPREALIVGAVLAALAFGLVLGTNVLTLGWSFAALLVAALYPFAKRVLSMPQAVLGVAFSMGIPMAFAAAQATVPGWSALLVLANLCWVLAYDTMYAMVDRDDDQGLGIRTSALTLGAYDRAALVIFSSLHLALWAWIAWIRELAPVFWLCWLVAALLAAALLHLAWSRERADCFLAFRRNHWVGLALLAGVILATGRTP